MANIVPIRLRPLTDVANRTAGSYYQTSTGIQYVDPKSGKSVAVTPTTNQTLDLRFPGWSAMTKDRKRAALLSNGATGVGNVVGSNRDVSSGLNYVGNRMPDGSLALDNYSPGELQNRMARYAGVGSTGTGSATGVAGIRSSKNPLDTQNPALTPSTPVSTTETTASQNDSTFTLAGGVNPAPMLDNPAFAPIPEVDNPNPGGVSVQEEMMTPGDSTFDKTKAEWMAQGGSPRTFNRMNVARGVRSRIDGRATSDPGRSTASDEIRKSWGWGSSLPY